eukprot:TRINITY_DN35976_c0_g1_i1.p1 TRINITY_DN35976_c0_g1~~TRINITY_DN35976_c0_g1_i1.p1  ORF type:complete len:268 (+),score=43.85 TRINITY_DN35976_c0_g1_i1:220-1023(+)
MPEAVGQEYCGASKVIVETGSRSDDDGLVSMMVGRKCGAKRLAFKCDKGLRSLEPVEKACTNLLPRKEVENDGFATRVLPWLYLGAALDANKESYIRKLNITHIVNLTQETAGITQWEFVKYLHITVKDHSDEPISDHFEEVITWLEDVRRTQGRVLVHCKQGISRSATMTIAYVMHLCRVPYRVAHDAVQSRRPAINPNLGFVTALEAFQKSLQIPHELSPTYTRQVLAEYQLSTTLIDGGGANANETTTPGTPRTAPPFASIGFS